MHTGRAAALGKGLAVIAVCGACLGGNDALAQGVAGDTPEVVAPLTLTPPVQTESMRRAQIRAFLTANSPALQDNEANLRRRMSLEERQALRESLNEAARGAYGSNHRRWPGRHD